MSRRRPPTTDSLELLLDTLCNTFGGVLFIAMLVVVLLQLSGKGAAARPRETVHAEDLHDLSDELDVLGRERAILARNLPKSPVEPALHPSPDIDPRARLAESQTRLEDLQRQKDAKLVETGRANARALAFDEEATDLKDRLAQADRETEDLRKQVEKEQKANARVVRTPVMHRTDKLALAVELRYDRLYVIHCYNTAGERLGPNFEEYVYLSETGDELVVTADPNRGMLIAEGPELVAALRRRLVSFPTDRWDLDLVVRADSFGVFHTLQEVARKVGYEMRVLLVSDAGSFQDRGGKRQNVQ